MDGGRREWGLSAQVRKVGIHMYESCLNLELKTPLPSALSLNQSCLLLPLYYLGSVYPIALEYLRT